MISMEAFYPNNKKIMALKKKIHGRGINGEFTFLQAQQHGFQFVHKGAEFIELHGFCTAFDVMGNAEYTVEVLNIMGCSFEQKKRLLGFLKKLGRFIQKGLAYRTFHIIHKVLPRKKSRERLSFHECSCDRRQP
jgi:hypothetical protein